MREGKGGVQCGEGEAEGRGGGGRGPVISLKQLSAQPLGHSQDIGHGSAHANDLQVWRLGTARGGGGRGGKGGKGGEDL